MNTSSIETSLVDIAVELQEIWERREKLLKEVRDVTSLASRAMVKMHTGMAAEARKELQQAGSLISKLKKGSGGLERYLTPAEAEYVEARLLYALTANESLPGRDELKVGNVSYLLGLLDFIGEVKRSTYDSVRKGEDKKAEKLFQLMDRLYVALSPFAAYDHVAQGVRRKLDVARSLVEDVRSTVTEEVRRREFMEKMEELSRKLSTEHGRKP